MRSKVIGLARKLKGHLVTELFARSFHLLISHRRRESRRQLTLMPSRTACAQLVAATARDPEVLAIASSTQRILTLLETAHMQALRQEPNTAAIAAAIDLLESSEIGAILVHARRSQIHPA